MDELEERLSNWGLCQRVTRTLSHCESIEHRYVFHRPRLTSDEIDRRRAPKNILDHKDAATIELAWRKIEVKTLQQLLKLSYVNRAPPQFICRHLNIRQSRDFRWFYLELTKAKHEIDKILRRNDESCCVKNPPMVFSAANPIPRSTRETMPAAGAATGKPARH